MTDFRIENNQLTDRPATEPAGVFIYQNMHVCDLQLPELAAHVAVAAAAAKELFGTDFRPDLRQTDSLCRQMLLRNRYPRELSSCIVMRLGAAGGVTFGCGGIFAHNGLAMNAVRPEAVSVAYDIPFGDMPTSVRMAAHEAALADARRRGFRSVVRCNAQGLAVTADDSPLFAVFGRRIITPATHPSVERDRVVRAAARSGYTLSEAPLEREALRRADELFYCDCRGITALARCDGRSYSDIIARAVAAGMDIHNSKTGNQR